MAKSISSCGGLFTRTDSLYVVFLANGYFCLDRSAQQWLPTLNDACDVFGRIRSDLAHSGKPIGPNDLLIAATAVANKLTWVRPTRKNSAVLRGCQSNTGERHFEPSLNCTVLSATIRAPAYAALFWFSLETKIKADSEPLDFFYPLSNPNRSYPLPIASQRAARLSADCS